MTVPLKRLRSEALELPLRDRAALAQELIASLDDAPEPEAGDVAHAWEQEIRERIAAYRAGELRSIPSEDVFAKARALLR
jgi:putative addiction module component (TIGR02574 family)